MANKFKKSLFVGAALLSVPALARAHTLPGPESGLAAGFTHPLMGWDHLLVMLVVGVWAAQLGGRSLWRIALARREPRAECEPDKEAANDFGKGVGVCAKRVHHPTRPEDLMRQRRCPAEQREQQRRGEF